MTLTPSNIVALMLGNEMKGHVYPNFSYARDTHKDGTGLVARKR